MQVVLPSPVTLDRSRPRQKSPVRFDLFCDKQFCLYETGVRSAQMIAQMEQAISPVLKPPIGALPPTG
jgi:hypothetical protein